MPFQTIESIDDGRLDVYRHLRTRNLTRYSRFFIAESKLLVQRLLRSDYQVESVLVDDKQIAEASEWLPQDINCLVVRHQEIDQLLDLTSIAEFSLAASANR